MTRKSTKRDTSRKMKATGVHSPDDVVQHLAADIGQLSKTAGVQVAELFIVKAHQIQKRGVYIANRNPVADGSQAEFVGLAAGRTTFYITARHPHHEVPRIVLAAWRFAHHPVEKRRASHL